MKKNHFIPLVLCIPLMFSACVSLETKQTETTKQAEILEVQKALDAFITVDEHAVGTDAADVRTGADVAELILSKAQIEVLEVQKDRWRVRISAPDMKELTEKARKKMSLSGTGSRIEIYQNAVDEMTAKLTQMLSKGEYKLLKKEVTLRVVNGEPVWEEDAVDALYGGLLGVYQDLLLEYKEVMDHENK